MINMAELIKSRLEEELQNSYLEYAMSVIVGRAIPDVRDGLKPVQRRILYTMYNLNNFSNQPTKKSAKIVGDCMGKYHPHGDAAIYDSLVRMAQPFATNYLLVDGQGNFGSIDGDPPAAMRYTEVRLTKIAEEMLEDLEKNAVDFIPNFDATEEEPVVLPAKVPNLLINGSSGIAVGVATNIPPHNLAEVCDAIIYRLNNKNAEIKDIINIIKGPDFPTGGIAIMNKDAIEGYITGRGQITIRAYAEINNEKKIIRITEIPYTVNKAMLIRKIADLVKEKKISGIEDIRDESDKEGISIIIELRKDIDPNQMLNFLYKNTQLEITYPIINLAVYKNGIKLFNILELIDAYIEHRREVIRRRTEFDLKIAKERLNIVDGLLIALEHIDEIIKIIRNGEDANSVKKELIEKFSINEKQAEAILDMKLSKLTKLENKSLLNEKDELLNKINNYETILSKQEEIDNIIKNELEELKKKYGRERRTRLLFEEFNEINEEDTIINTDVVILITNKGYVKRLPLSEYRLQMRGGKGIISMKISEGDYVKQVITTKNRNYLLALTNKGRAYWIKAYEIPEMQRYAEGKVINNLINLQNDEKIVKIVSLDDFNSNIIILTKKGIIKKMPLLLFSNPRITGIIAIKIDENDEVKDAIVYKEKENIIITTKFGMSLRFKESEVKQMGRVAKGVRGIRLKAQDEAQNIIACNESGNILTISENGFGKITNIGEYRLQHRGGIGIKTMRITEKTGSVVKSLFIKDEEALLIVSSSGISIQIPISSIRETGRVASGVKLIRLDENERVVDASLI